MSGIVIVQMADEWFTAVRGPAYARQSLNISHLDEQSYLIKLN
jgi:hypothetical protein